MEVETSLSKFELASYYIPTLAVAQHEGEPQLLLHFLNVY